MPHRQHRISGKQWAIEIFRIAIFSGSNRCLMVTSPNCCVKTGMFSLSVDERVLKNKPRSFSVCAAHPAQTNYVCVLLIWDFMESPLEINRDRAHATSKHQSRLRCRWTLCPFITHALNHLAVISLATGEGIPGHLTSCIQSSLWRSVNRIYSSQSILLAIPQFSFWKANFLCQIIPFLPSVFL